MVLSIIENVVSAKPRVPSSKVGKDVLRTLVKAIAEAGVESGRS